MVCCSHLPPSRARPGTGSSGQRRDPFLLNTNTPKAGERAPASIQSRSAPSGPPETESRRDLWRPRSNPSLAARFLVREPALQAARRLSGQLRPRLDFHPAEHHRPARSSLHRAGLRERAADRPVLRQSAGNNEPSAKTERRPATARDREWIEADMMGAAWITAGTCGFLSPAAWEAGSRQRA